MVPSTELRAHAGERVRLVGILDTCRRVETEAGEDMEFLTFEDEAGIFEVALFPAAYAAFARRIRGWGPYLITGRVQEHLGALSVTGERIEPAAREGRAPAPARRVAAAGG